jgi:methyl-accepting chemotaxis protein
MHQETIDLVQASWKKVVPIAPQAAALFYAKLFELDPALRALFKGDMQAQGMRLMQMIDTAVKGLGDLPSLTQALQDLGRRHATYGVQEKDYGTVGAALLQTLGELLVDAFTPAVREAWTSVYAALAHTMIAATATSS